MKATAAALVAALVLAGCGGSSKPANHSGGASTRTASSATAGTGTSSTVNTTATPPVTLARGFRLSSPAFKQNAAIPKQYTCDGADVAIPLRWSGVPKSARELVLVMRDPDAPSGDFVHWAVAGISPRASSPSGVQGRNGFGSVGYRGPCPPPGKAHHYVITLDALSGPSNLKPGFTPDQLRTAAVGIATLVGTYARS